jgi:hypothetical protein
VFAPWAHATSKQGGLVDSGCNTGHGCSGRGSARAASPLAAADAYQTCAAAFRSARLGTPCADGGRAPAAERAPFRDGRECGGARAPSGTTGGARTQRQSRTSSTLDRHCPPAGGAWIVSHRHVSPRRRPQGEPAHAATGRGDHGGHAGPPRAPALSSGAPAPVAGGGGGEFRSAPRAWCLHRGGLPCAAKRGPAGPGPRPGWVKAILGRGSWAGKPRCPTVPSSGRRRRRRRRRRFARTMGIRRIRWGWQVAMASHRGDSSSRRIRLLEGRPPPSRCARPSNFAPQRRGASAEPWEAGDMG